MRAKRSMYREAANQLVHEAILGAAVVLFRKQGYPGTSIREIAKAVDLPQSTIYHYFKSKEDILYQIANLAGSKMLQGLEELAARDISIVEKLQEAIRYHLVGAERHQDELLVLHQETKHLGRKHYRQIIAMRDRYEELLKEMVLAGTAHGMFRAVDPQFTAFSILGICNWAYFWYKAGERPADEIADKFTDLIFDGLLAVDGKNPVPALEASVAAT